MQHDITPVLHDPRTLFVAFGRRRLVSAGLHFHASFVAQRMHLARVRARRDDEKVHDRSDARQIEDDGVLATEFFANLCDMAGVFQTLLETGIRGFGDDGNSSTPGNVEINFGK